MTLGTAKITNADRFWIVTYSNVGNFLKTEPRFFSSEKEARTWCKDQALRIVS